MTQVLPDGDTFELTAFAVQPPYLCMYLGCEPRAATFGPAWLHAGYSAPSIGFYSAAFSFSDGSPTRETEPRAVVYRRSFTQQQAAQATFVVAQAPGFGGSVLTPANSSAAVLRFGVLCRVNVGTQTDPTLYEIRYTDCTGYELSARVSGADLIFEVTRYNTGTATLVASQTLTGLATGVDFRAPFALRMYTVDSGANPTILCTLKQFTFAGVQATDFALFSTTATGGLYPPTPGAGATIAADGLITDANASKVLGAGHAGFVMGRDRKLATFTPTTDVVDLCLLFHVEQSLTIVVRDEFKRTTGGSAYLVTDSMGYVGESLAQDYRMDHFASVSGSRELEWDGAVARAIYKPSASSDSRMAFMSRRPANSARNQRRSVSLQFLTTTTAPDVEEAGIMLRGSGPTEAGSVFAYIARLRVNYTGPVYTVELVRMRGLTETILASLALASFLGVAQSLDFEIYLNADSLLLDGPAVMKVRIGGVQQILLTSNVSGVTVDVNGTVTDYSADRISSGDGEGVWARNQSTLGDGRHIRIDTWAQGAIQSEIAPAQQATLVLTNEVGYSDGNLDNVLSPEFSHTCEYIAPLSGLVSDAGGIITWPTTTKTRRLYSFSRSACTDAELQALVAFWDAHRGHESSFVWTPPSGEGSGIFCMVEDSLRWSPNGRAQAAFSSWSVEFQVLELFDA